MKVVSITTTSDEKEYLVILENKSKFRASSNVLFKYELAPGKDLSSREIKEIKSTASDDRMYHALLRLITGRLKTEYEIKQYLKRKNVEEDKINSYVIKLKEVKLIDDKKYIDSYVHDQNLKAPISKTKLIFKLRSKGLAKNIIDDYFNSNKQDEEADLKRLIEIKRRQLKFKDDLKLKAYLVRSGYNYSLVNKVLNNSEY